MSGLPLVVVCGATGCGKTRLGVQLARRLRPAHVLSADSMQVYKGLDIITAKPTTAERAAAPHHLVDFLEPHQTFTVVDFRNRALKIINNLIENGTTPIVVGGTIYYLESIMWKILVEDVDDWDSLLCERDENRKKRMKIDEPAEDVDVKTEEEPIKFKDRDEESKCVVITSKVEDTIHDTAITANTDVVEQGIEKASTSVIQALNIKSLNEDVMQGAMRDVFENDSKFTNEELHRKLAVIDPVMAKKLHPNNRRKILRAIEVWLKAGRRHSEILEEQADSEKQLRRKDSTIVFWLKCEQKVHDERLDARVDAMLEEGLVKELLDYHVKYNQQRLKEGQPPDYTKGIFQTLGFKEFHQYLMLSEEERSTEAGEKLLRECIGNLKMATKRYSRRQNKMVRLRFLDHPFREIPPIYELDVTDISKWDDNVKNKAITIIECFLNNTKCPFEPLAPSDSVQQMKLVNIHSSNKCDICDRIFIGDIQFGIHMKSNKHQKMVKRLKKLADKTAGGGTLCKAEDS